MGPVPLSTSQKRAQKADSEEVSRSGLVNEKVGESLAE